MTSPARALLELPPYGLDQVEKRARLLPMLRELTEHHARHCLPYRNVLDRVFGGADRLRIERLEDVPFLPVTLFKTHALSSVPENEVVKVLTSSGTTGQAPSRIFLDAETASVQSAVLVKVAQRFLGKDRLPMVILDHPGVVRDRRSFSARGAGILGMAQFGHRPFYALREDMSLDLEGLRAYLAWAAGRKARGFVAGTVGSVAGSPDGKSVYVASIDSDAVAIFARNTTTGALKPVWQPGSPKSWARGALAARPGRSPISISTRAPWTCSARSTASSSTPRRTVSSAPPRSGSWRTTTSPARSSCTTRPVSASCCAARPPRRRRPPRRSPRG